MTMSSLKRYTVEISIDAISSTAVTDWLCHNLINEIGEVENFSWSIYDDTGKDVTYENGGNRNV